MTWRVAKSLEKLLEQVNAAAPGRAKGWDGTIGDAAHSARDSDHNPDAKGVVRALDITHDPKGGVDSERLADTLRLSRDPRIKYIISNRKIAAGYAVHGEAAWTWRPYAGENPHDHHCHISVVADDALADDVKTWPIDAAFAAAPPSPDRPGLSRGIVATMFGGPADAMSGAETAYGNQIAPGWWDRPGVALPARINDRPLPLVKVTYNGKSIICPVIDVGPWNTKDPYWISGARPQAESGFDMTGRKTNFAGIDLTPAAANAIGLPGKGLVDWEIVSEQTKETPVTDTTGVTNEQVVKEMQAGFAQLTTVLGAILSALKGAAPVTVPIAEPKPVIVPDPVPVAPTLPTPGLATGTGIMTGALAIIMQLLGYPVVGEGASTVTSAIPAVAIGSAALGLSGWGGILTNLLGGVAQWAIGKIAPSATK